MSKRRKVLMMIGLVVLIIVLAAQLIIRNIEKNLEGLKTLELATIDLEQAADGVYEGTYAAFPVSAKVRVELKDHRITSIELLEHRHGQGANAEVLTEIVVQAQSLDVDLVAGASYSSKVILKAIEDALMKAGD